MKILLLGLNYLPESTSIGPYTADLAEHLKSTGHDVRVATSYPTAPGWKLWSQYSGKRFMRETLNGVPILRCYLYVPRDPRKTLQRILFDCSFAASSLATLITTWRPETILVISPPLQLAISGVLIGALTGAKVFLQIQDLVPDAAVAVGALRPGSLALRVASAMERFAYRKSEAIAVICDGMRKNLLAKGVPPQKVHTIHNSIDLSSGVADPETASSFRPKVGISPDRFLVMYSGSVAGKQGLQTFVKAAHSLNDTDGVTCCLIGDGPFLPELKQLAAGLSSDRFLFLPLQPRESLASQLAAADVLLITQQKSVRDAVFPGKLLYYMAAGRPILASVSEDSETGRFIQDNQVGIVVPPEDPERLAEAVRWLHSNPSKALELGINGRRVVENQFDRRIVLDRMTAFLTRSSQSLHPEALKFDKSRFENE